MNFSSDPSPGKILVVRLGAMGDVIHAIPAVASLRVKFPRAEIGWVIERRWSDLINPYALVDRVHEVDTRGWRKHLLASETRHEIGRALRELRAEKYEIAVDFQGAIKSSAIALLSGAPIRCGFANPWEKPASLFYTHPVITEKEHVVAQNLELARSVTGRQAPPSMDEIAALMPPDPKMEAWASEKLLAMGLGSSFAILNPGAGWGAKQWPVERYAEVARELGSEGIRSLVNYGPGEEALARAVEQGSAGHAVAACFTIAELMAVTRRASLFIGGDTGPMHLAALFGVPVVAIFGPTDPARNGPYGTKSIVLRDAASQTSHKRFRQAELGLLNITTEQVLRAGHELLTLGRTEARA